MTNRMRIVGCAFAVLALAGGTQALAHSGTQATAPGNGAVVRALPAFVKITFSEPIGRVAFVKVTDAKGADHVVTAGIDPKSAARVLARTRDRLVAGRYRATWKVVAADGHSQSGTFAFRVRP